MDVQKEVTALEANLIELLNTLPLEELVKFREKTIGTQKRQLEIIDQAMIKKGHIGTIITVPDGGYHD